MTQPEVGLPLPRAADAYSSAAKWALWILADDAHGPAWRRVFGPVERVSVWPALASRLLTAPVVSMRFGSGNRLTCRVDVLLTVNDRTATVRTIWHYADEHAAPRLVTAFPTT